jgi:hypothetical protein
MRNPNDFTSVHEPEISTTYGVATLLEAVRDRTKVVDLKQVNRSIASYSNPTTA